MTTRGSGDRGAAGRVVTACATIVAVAVCGCSVSVRRNDVAPETARQAAEALLAHGAAAWNHGDLDGFMSDYAADATYVTPREVVHGAANIKARYAPRFEPGGVRDSLHFERLEVEAVGPNTLNAIAYYVLTRRDSVVARGPTSLVLRRDEQGRWHIQHDHSS